MRLTEDTVERHCVSVGRNEITGHQPYLGMTQATHNSLRKALCKEFIIGYFHYLGTYLTELGLMKGHSSL